MLLNVSRDLFLFSVVVFGLGLPIAWTTPQWSPLERLCVAVAAALTVTSLFAFGVYLTDASLLWYWALPAAAVALATLRWRATVAFFAEAEIQRAVGLWLLLALWSLGLQSLIVSYSGGGWAGDCWEHYDRARFFLEHWPRDVRFLGKYWLPARPPLANLATSAFLALTETSFARYQIFTTLLSTLVFLPSLLWFHRFRTPGGRATLVLLLFLVSPLFAVNVTFPATKLVATAFVLTGLALLHRNSPDADAPCARYAGWLALAAGLLAHYSAGPWLVAAAVAVSVERRGELKTRKFWREQAVTAALCGLLLAPWFGWSLATYGWRGTVATNSTVVGAAHESVAGEGAMIARNVRNTIVPHFLRHFDKSALAQTNRLGAIRDYFFNLYQVNLFFEFGSIGGLLLLALIAHRAGEGRIADQVFWWALLTVAVSLGIAVNSQPDDWGQAQICLKPLALLGLTFLAASAPKFSPVLRVLFIGGLIADFLLGVVLQFGLQSFALNRWLEPGKSESYYASTLGVGGQLNFNAKEYLHLAFLGDYVAPHAGYVVAGLSLILGFVIVACLAGKRAAAN